LTWYIGGISFDQCGKKGQLPITIARGWRQASFHFGRVAPLE